MNRETHVVDDAWAGLTAGEKRPSLRVAGQWSGLTSALPVEDAAIAAVSLALSAGVALHERHVGHPVEGVLDRECVARAMTSERQFTLAGQPAAMGFAPLSAFWRAADGWVRTHANYAWHRAALLETMDVSEALDPHGTHDQLAAAIRGCSAREVEEGVFHAGGIAVRVRSSEEWAASEQGRAVAMEPVVGHSVLPGAHARRRGAGALPAEGVRVLDLTRVIAGPVCTRYLGALGADVLRLDGPARHDLERGVAADTLLGKRSAELNFSLRSGLDLLHELLGRADVLVCGYRPGSLDHFGLTNEELAERHPGLVVVALSAWGHSGPWARRRGFDSIVQAATGIAVAEGSPERPGSLPCQLLDHGAGYLAAAAALDGLRRQESSGGTHFRTLSLARTAHWLMDASPSKHSSVAFPETVAGTARLISAGGIVEAVQPPGSLNGVDLFWPHHVSGYMDDEPRWRKG